MPNPNAAKHSLEEVVIDYTNWKGERRNRRIRPHHMMFTRTKYHPERGWILIALDIEKGEMREFACRNIHSWKEPQSNA